MHAEPIIESIAHVLVHLWILAAHEDLAVRGSEFAEGSPELWMLNVKHGPCPFHVVFTTAPPTVVESRPPWFVVGLPRSSPRKFYSGRSVYATLLDVSEGWRRWSGVGRRHGTDIELNGVEGESRLEGLPSYEWDHVCCCL